MKTQSSLLRKIPSVDEVLKEPTIISLLSTYSRDLVVQMVRSALSEIRLKIKSQKKISTFH